MPFSLAGLFKGGVKDVVDSVGKVLDNVITTKDELETAKLKMAEEINRNFEALQAQANEMEKAYLESIKSAQEMNVKIQETANASWMSKNIAYIIDIFVTALWGGLTAYLMMIMLNLVKKDVNVDYTAVTAVWGAVTGVFTQVLSFHRGSSRGSEEKQKTIDRLTK